MQKILRFIILLIIGAAAITLWDGFFILPEGQQAVITQFGAPVGSTGDQGRAEIQNAFHPASAVFRQKDTHLER